MINVCDKIECPFRKGGCKRYTISAMCHLGDVVDFRNFESKEFTHNQYWLWMNESVLTEEIWAALIACNAKFLETDITAIKMLQRMNR